MLKIRLRVIGVLAAILLCRMLASGSFLTISTTLHAERSGAVFRGVVQRTQAFEDEGQVWTRAALRVEEVFKGKLPEVVEVVYRGGYLPHLGETSCNYPDLKAGEERLFFLSKGKSGKARFTRGAESAFKIKPGNQQVLQEFRGQSARRRSAGEDFTSDAAGAVIESAAESAFQVAETIVSATNLLSTARFTQADGGGKIRYLIDCDFLPAGMTVSQAVWAVTTALDAWAKVSSARFEFAGFQSFGAPAANVQAADGVLRIQLHDIYESLEGAMELGEGGRAWSIQNTPSGWTTGGRVAGTDFHKVVRGYVTLKHTSQAMTRLMTFTEVLTHEIGHALGLGHSSQNHPEPDATLRESVMYWLAHDDGRGAALNTWDVNVCSQLHPANTPPVCVSRYLEVITSPTIPLEVPGVNTVRIPAMDLQGSPLTFEMADVSSGNGTFSLSDGKVRYVPKANYSDSDRLDPSTGQAWDRAHIRVSDGVNASAWAEVAVISLNRDDYNEGVPNWWRNSYFGSPDPNAGAKHKANDDADGDGYTNIQEWRMFSDPSDPNSNLWITSMTASGLEFEARDYDVYQVFRSTDLQTWTPQWPLVVGRDFTGAFSVNPSDASRAYFKVKRIE